MLVWYLYGYIPVVMHAWYCTIGCLINISSAADKNIINTLNKQTYTKLRLKTARLLAE